MGKARNIRSISTPFPWFGMNHIWNRQWDMFDWDEKDRRWLVGKELKERLSNARAIDLNLNRFSLNVFDFVRAKHGADNSVEYLVEPEPLQKLATLIKFCSKNGISSLPVLMSGGDPGISRFDPSLLMGKGLERFMNGYASRSAALVHALEREVRGGIAAYEIENEFNHGIHHPFWDDYGRFQGLGIELLARCGRAVRKETRRPLLYNWDFDYPLFLRGELDLRSFGRRTEHVTELMIDDFQSLIDAGAPVDIIGLDVYPDPGSRGPFGGGRGYSNISLDDAGGIVERLCSGFKNKKVVVAETGLSEYNALHIPDQEAQRDFYVRSMKLFHEVYLRHRRNFLGVIYYEWKDAKPDHWGLIQELTFWRKEKNFGIFDSEMRPKKTYQHLKKVYQD